MQQRQLSAVQNRKGWKWEGGEEGERVDDPQCLHPANIQLFVYFNDQVELSRENKARIGYGFNILWVL